MSLKELMRLEPVERSVALIADDDDFFRVALSTILRSQLAFSVVLESGSFDEAIELLSTREEVTIALFDLAMPGLGNPAGLRAVRECFPDTRVSVVSASRRRRDILMALAAGVHGYVPKSLGVAELGEALDAICDGFIYVPPAIAELAASEGEAELSPTPEATAGPVVLDRLSGRQREVLHLLVEGQSNKEMARALDLSPGTVKFHLAALFRHLGVGNRVEAAAAAARLLAGQRQHR